MKNSYPNKTIRIGGVDIHNMTMAEAVDRVDELVRKSLASCVVTPNVDHVVRYQKDATFRQVYAHAALVLPDGMPLVWASHFLGTPFQGRVSGADLVPALCPLAVKKGYGIFLLGGRPGAAERAKIILEKKYHGLRIVGVYSPPFGFERDLDENRRILERIKRASPDILLVGLGSPKQEKWAFQNSKELNVPVTIGVGVTFEFIAGMVRRAPGVFQRSGFEWLWRLFQEPGRLWKRYLVEDPLFFWLIMKQRISP